MPLRMQWDDSIFAYIYHKHQLNVGKYTSPNGWCVVDFFGKLVGKKSSRFFPMDLPMGMGGLQFQGGK